MLVPKGIQQQQRSASHLARPVAAASRGLGAMPVLLPRRHNIQFSPRPPFIAHLQVGQMRHCGRKLVKPVVCGI